MMNFVVVFLVGAILGAKTKEGILTIAIIGGLLNVVMLWQSFQIYPMISGWDQWLLSLPFIGSLFSNLIGAVQILVDIPGAIYAFLQAGAACSVGWFVGKYWLKKKRWI